MCHVDKFRDSCRTDKLGGVCKWKLKSKKLFVSISWISKHDGQSKYKNISDDRKDSSGSRSTGMIYCGIITKKVKTKWKCACKHSSYRERFRQAVSLSSCCHFLATCPLIYRLVYNKLGHSNFGDEDGEKEKEAAWVSQYLSAAVSSGCSVVFEAVLRFQYISTKRSGYQC